MKKEEKKLSHEELIVSKKKELDEILVAIKECDNKKSELTAQAIRLDGYIDGLKQKKE